jgi:hypothetical protein
VGQERLQSERLVLRVTPGPITMVDEVACSITEFPASLYRNGFRLHVHRRRSKQNCRSHGPIQIRCRKVPMNMSTADLLVPRARSLAIADGADYRESGASGATAGRRPRSMLGARSRRGLLPPKSLHQNGRRASVLQTCVKGLLARFGGTRTLRWPRLMQWPCLRPSAPFPEWRKSRLRASGVGRHGGEG